MLKSVSPFSEQQIQNLIFDYPSCLPISYIDESYNPVIPVCKELQTNAGALDIFMITPNGDLILIETKLWSNPEARRKVVAQILDYAKELSRWTYGDLQREVNKKLGTKGNILYELSLKTDKENVLNEIDFVDAVSRNLRIGKFMLIIAGDGIREGAKNLTEFINKAGNLNFSLAMIELPIYQSPNDALVVLPRIIVKTVEIQKINIEVSEGLSVISDIHHRETEKPDKEVSKEVKERRKFFTAYWKEFVSQLEFDDPEQSLPPITKSQNIYLYPGRDKNSWISAYFAKSMGRVGVYFRFHSNQNGVSQKERLDEFKEDIKEELGDEVLWYWNDSPTHAFGARLHLDDVYDKGYRQTITEFFSFWMNKFVNVIRPRLNQYE